MKVRELVEVLKKANYTDKLVVRSNRELYSGYFVDKGVPLYIQDKVIVEVYVGTDGLHVIV